MAEENPRLFISYSWTSLDHEQWVVRLATELRESGVDAILDKWDLREGHDADAFMEKMATDPTIKKVVLVCDRAYAEKANGRKGGVGTETQIITPEIYSKSDQSKFVAVLPERDEQGQPFLPVYYKSRIYIDLSDSERYSAGLEQLLRWVFDRPQHKKPDIGKAPVYLADDTAIGLGTGARSRRALEAIRESRPHAAGAISDYFETFVANLERFRIHTGGAEFDEQVLSSVESFIPFRDEACQLVKALCRFRASSESWELIHDFFEGLIPYLGRPPDVQNWREEYCDNYRFMIHELLLHCVAIMLKEACFGGVGLLVGQEYFVGDTCGRGGDSMVPFTVFRSHLPSLEPRNKRLGLRRLSLHADILKRRTAASLVSFDDLMQADFIMFVRDQVDSLEQNRRRPWWPVTLIFAEDRYNPFEVFARSQSAAYFNRVQAAFDGDLRPKLDKLMAAYKEGKIRLPQWEHRSFDPAYLMGLDKLGKLP